MLLSDWRQFVEADSTIARPPAAARPLLALFSGVSAFVHGLAFATALGYGLYHLLLQSQLIALLSFVSCFGIAMSHWRSAHDRDATSYRYLVIGAMTLELVITSYMLGYRGLILVFPLTASFLFLLPFKQAVWLGVLAVLACLLASSNVLELEVVVRHGIALLLSLGFSAAFAYSLHQQKDALDADVNQDYLTGIASRRGFTRWLDSLPSRTDMQAKPMALFYVDIDDFKRINDTYGHATGDALLAQFCQRVMGCLREEDKVYIRNRCVNFARLAGDEFALAILDVADQSSAEHIARRIFERLSSPFSLPGTEVRVHASIGILYIEAIEQPADALLIQADKAMYYAKQRGKNQYQFFDARLAEAISERKRIEMGLTRAVNENAFDLVFMPIVDTQTLRIVGAEALLRCSDEQLAGVAPESYILVAEQQGLIREIDLLVLEKAFSRIAAIESDPRYDHLTFAINISAIELHNQGFPARLSKLLVEHDIPPRRIELEITETALIAQDEASLAVLHELRAIGVGLSLDDFGTGYIAFNQLMNYPVGQLKIDRSFINALSECGPSDRSLVDIVIALAHHFDIDVVAEGVETIEQLEYLKARRCRYAQGFLFSRPLPWSQFIALCQSHGALDQGGAAVSPLSVGTKRLNIVS